MMGFGGGGLFMLLVWVIVLVAIAMALRPLWSRREPRRDAESGGSALEILGRRYAHGEIDREEFEAKKRDLDESRR